MKTILLENQQVNIYDVKEFPYILFSNYPTISKRNRRYVNCIGTFDIETTSIITKEEKFGFMYVWQACIDGIVVMGRTWDEFISLINNLKDTMRLHETKRRFVMYIHFLSFEFQFLRNFFKITDVFCREKRDVVYCVLNNCIELRCSYTLTNMGLDKFLKKTKGVTIHKQSGKDFNYSILRYPDTPLTDEEYGYCVADVLGLWQGVTSLLREDSLLTIPITSTGYVRRDFRASMQKMDDLPGYMGKSALDKECYILCREASRGAISGSNHVWTNQTLEDIDSEDIKSSYPFQMMTKYFPSGKFITMRVLYKSDKWYKLTSNMCCLITFSCKNMLLKQWSAIPYISKAKCRAIEGAKCGNGKVYGAKRIGMVCTEIDFAIIEEQYYMEDVVIHDFKCCEREQLPYEFRKVLGDMFQIKTDLEDGDPFDYAKYKNKINASFGMMLTDILHPEIEYIEDVTECWNSNEIKDIVGELKRYYGNKNSFLHYQHGVWVLAHGRDDLNNGMQIVGSDIVQVDTDSVKHHDDYSEQFNQLNMQIIANAEKYDVKPYSIKNGHKHYLGIWEHEGKDGEFTYSKFRTLGAKKYCYIDGDGKLGLTVAGLNKSNGAKYLEKIGGIDYFRPGVIFPKEFSGRTTSYYNDLIGIHKRNINGHMVTYGSNIGVENTEYTLGATGEWLLMVLDGEISEHAFINNADGAFKNYLKECDWL